MSEDWTWFVDAVDRYILPILEMYHFTQLTGKGNKPDIQPYPNDPAGGVSYYKNNMDVYATVDVLIRTVYLNDRSQFYWLMIAVGEQNLKMNISDLPTLSNKIYEAQGWVFNEKSEIDSILIEVTQVLTDYLGDKTS